MTGEGVEMYRHLLHCIPCHYVAQPGPGSHEAAGKVRYPTNAARTPLKMI